MSLLISYLGSFFLSEMISLSINFIAAFAAASAWIWTLVLRIFFFTVPGTGVLNDDSNDISTAWMLLLETELARSPLKDFELLLSFSETKQVEPSSELSSELLDIFCRQLCSRYSKSLKVPFCCLHASNLNSLRFKITRWSEPTLIFTS